MMSRITDRDELLRLEKEYERMFGVEPEWTGYEDPVAELREAVEAGKPIPVVYDPFTRY